MNRTKKLPMCCNEKFPVPCTLSHREICAIVNLERKLEFTTYNHFLFHIPALMPSEVDRDKKFAFWCGLDDMENMDDLDCFIWSEVFYCAGILDEFSLDDINEERNNLKKY
jgi:hypothetical protein